MEVQAITKMSACPRRKCAKSCGRSRACRALQAQAVLAVVPRKGARFVAKTLKSAIANAEDQAHNRRSQLKTETLRVKEAVARNRDDPETVHAQGARFGRADSQTQLPHQNHFVRRIINYGPKN